MQARQRDRHQYFDELAATSRKYYVPYLSEYLRVGKGVNVLEIGCGEGGNLLPFAQAGCTVMGVDMAAGKIADARRFFAENDADGQFLASDIFEVKELEGQFDLILCHDVIEHIHDKEEFMRRTRAYLRPEGMAFFAFPAWQMPFGGHQQMCRNRMLSRLPFFHLLPQGLYRRLLEYGGETPETVSGLLEIKDTATSIGLFEQVIRNQGFKVVDRRLWLVNPHYEAKFGLRPRRLPDIVAALSWVRGFLSTSCFYLLRP